LLSSLLQEFSDKSKLSTVVVTMSPTFLNNTLDVYLSQLLRERQQLASLQLGALLANTIRLVEAEIVRVEGQVRQVGERVRLSEKVFIPGDQKFGSNLVGRILGPGGVTVRRLEQQLGCSLRVRGKGSCRDKEDEERRKEQVGWEHLGEELHVLICFEGPECVARDRMSRAVATVRTLLSPMEDKDELKRSQLVELAIRRGTYREQAEGEYSNSLTSSQGTVTPLSTPSQVLAITDRPSVYSQSSLMPSPPLMRNQSLIPSPPLLYNQSPVESPPILSPLPSPPIMFSPPPLPSPPLLSWLPPFPPASQSLPSPHVARQMRGRGLFRYHPFSR